jgi:hypothetical protein
MKPTVTASYDARLIFRPAAALALQRRCSAACRTPLGGLRRQCLFRAACNMGLEGLVSKRRDRPYRGGRSKDLSKHPAMERVKDAFS